MVLPSYLGPYCSCCRCDIYLVTEPNPADGTPWLSGIYINEMDWLNSAGAALPSLFVLILFLVRDRTGIDSDSALRIGGLSALFNMSTCLARPLIESASHAENPTLDGGWSSLLDRSLATSCFPRRNGSIIVDLARFTARACAGGDVVY